MLNPIQGRLFFELLRPGGHIVLPFENHVPLVLTAYCEVFLKACPKLDHMTHFGFHGNWFRCFLGGSKLFFPTKTLTKDTAQIVLFFVFHEGTNGKIDLCTYVRLTLNGNYVGWA